MGNSDAATSRTTRTRFPRRKLQHPSPPLAPPRLPSIVSRQSSPVNRLPSIVSHQSPLTVSHRLPPSPTLWHSVVFEAKTTKPRRKPKDTGGWGTHHRDDDDDGAKEEKKKAKPMKIPVISLGAGACSEGSVTSLVSSGGQVFFCGSTRSSMMPTMSKNETPSASGGGKGGKDDVKMHARRERYKFLAEDLSSSSDDDDSSGHGNDDDEEAANRRRRRRRTKKRKAKQKKQRLLMAEQLKAAQEPPE